MAKAAFAIACHPDDIEFGMAGTLIKLKEAGYEIHYMNIANAASIGLIPPSLANRARAVGNTALQGAALCLFDSEARTDAALLASRTRVVELSFSQAFQEAYVENMMF